MQVCAVSKKAVPSNSNTFPQYVSLLGSSRTLSTFGLLDLFSLSLFLNSGGLILMANTVTMDLVVVPRSNIGVDATAELLTAALSSHKLRDLLDGQVLFQGGQESGADDFDLTTSLLIKETLDNSPDAAK